MNASQIFSWFQLNYPHIIEEWSECSHHYSLEFQNKFHLEGTVLNHYCQVMLAAELQENNLKNVFKIDDGTSHLGVAAAMFHDLGKPSTRKENHEKKRVSMIGHEPVSAFMALEIMEKLSEKTPLSVEDKINIFNAICYHIDFHKVIAECYKANSFDAFIARYKGFSDMGRILVQLGVSDSLGRFSDPDISPKEPRLWTLYKEMNEQKVFDKLVREPTVNDSKPEVQILVGLPCSGKSTYRAKRMGYTHICRDDIIMEMAQGKSYTEAFHSVDSAKVNAELDKRTKAAVRNQESVIFDLTNLVKARRAATLTQFKNYHKKAVVFLEDLVVVQVRNKARQEREGKFIPDEVYHNMMTSYTPPSYEEFDEIEYWYKSSRVVVK